MRIIFESSSFSNFNKKSIFLTNTQSNWNMWFNPTNGLLGKKVIGLKGRVCMSLNIWRANPRSSNCLEIVEKVFSPEYKGVGDASIWTQSASDIFFLPCSIISDSEPWVSILKRSI